MERSKIELTNECNMQIMARYPNDYFDLAIVDPEYGINASNMTMGNGKNKKYKKKDWDNSIPKKEYFDELFRVSKNQIVCGGNYFTEHLKPTKSWIFWDKGINGDCSFADGELFWTSFDCVLRIAPIIYKGFLGADKERIHITQKPVKLYEWLLSNYAKEGDKILDTHAGSASIALACWNLKFDLTACELDLDYYNAAVKRLENHKRQIQMF